jgi:hypothetical protein
MEWVGSSNEAGWKIYLNRLIPFNREYGSFWEELLWRLGSAQDLQQDGYSGWRERSTVNVKPEGGIIKAQGQSEVSVAAIRCVISRSRRRNCWMQLCFDKTNWFDWLTGSWFLDWRAGISEDGRVDAVLEC